LHKASHFSANAAATPTHLSLSFRVAIGLWFLVFGEFHKTNEKRPKTNSLTTRFDLTFVNKIRVSALGCWPR